MNWDVEKTRSENCQLRILRRHNICGKTSLRLILSDSTTFAYEPMGGGGVGGWREHYIQLAIQLETFGGGGGVSTIIGDVLE